MRITMKSLCALPSGALEAGKTYDVPTSRGRSLIAGGYAVAVDEDPATGGKRKPRKRAQSRKKPTEPAGGEDGGSSREPAGENGGAGAGENGGAGEGGGE